MGIFRWIFLGYNLCLRAHSGHAYVFNNTNTDRIKLSNDFSLATIDWLTCKFYKNISNAVQKRWRSIKFAGLQNSSDVVRLIGGKAWERGRKKKRYSIINNMIYLCMKMKNIRQIIKRTRSSSQWHIEQFRFLFSVTMIQWENNVRTRINSIKASVMCAIDYELYLYGIKRIPQAQLIDPNWIEKHTPNSLTTIWQCVHFQFTIKP